jgi:hypothetical protein
VFSRLPRLAIAAALAFSIGLHWELLQSVAWVGMVVNYSQSDGVEQALEKTFDGKHPCALCKVVAEGKKSEKKPEAGPVAKKFEFSYSAANFVFAAPSDYWEVGWPERAGTSLSIPPPVPPPRQLPG